MATNTEVKSKKKQETSKLNKQKQIVQPMIAAYQQP